MRNLLVLFVTAALVLLNATVIAQAPPGSLWYNGDWNFENGLANERNTAVTQAAVYDDFDVTAPLGWNVTAVFSDNIWLGNTVTVTGADWEIRTGVSEGNGGILVASGTTNSPLVTLTGRSTFEYTEHMVEVTGLNLVLPHLASGFYFLTVSPIVPPGVAGYSFQSTTSGTNCVGTPCGNDDNSWWNSTLFGTNFTSTTNLFGAGTWDLSGGVLGTVVPEPATMALLICGVITLLIALRRRRLLLRATLLTLFVAAVSTANTTAIAQAPPGSLWYNGDYNGVQALANERNTQVTQAAVYDDFNVTAPMGWHVTAVFSDNFEFTNITAAVWEIRTGISEGSAGTLIASGTTNSPVVTQMHCGINGCLLTEVEVKGLSVFLPMLPSGQHYWLNVTPVGDGTGRSYNWTTSGTNCVGSPCGNDDNAFWNSTYFGAYFTNTLNECDNCPDFSMGVIGTVVPEPATVALLFCGVVALLIALRHPRLLLRATLRALFAVTLALNVTAVAQAPPGSLWYNGDFNGVNGLSNERNTLVSQASVYDDFNVTAPLGWNVTAVFSDDLISTVVTGADWEIRTGVSPGNGGTLIASGTMNSPVVTPTGRSGFGYTEYMVEVTGLNVFLPTLPSGQHYWLNVTPVGNGTGRSFNTTTSGANCVGTPCGNDGNSFFNSPPGYYFTGPGPYDFSDGVIGTVVPEPATVALLTCGVGALLIAWRRRGHINVAVRLMTRGK